MHNPFIRRAVAVLCACLLLLLGAALLLTAFYFAGTRIGLFDPDGRAQLGMTVYYRVVIIKGLLSQLVLTLALWPLVSQAHTRLGGRAPMGRLRLLLEYLLAGAIGFAVVAPLLLTVEFEGWPALRMPTLGNKVGSFVLMTMAAAFCAWLPHALLSTSRPLEAAKPPSDR